MEQNWFFSVDRVSTGQAILSVYRLESSNVEFTELDAEGLFELYRNWEGRNIYTFGAITNVNEIFSSYAEADENDGVVKFHPKRDGEIYSYNNINENSYQQTSGSDTFLNILQKTNQIAIQLIDEANGLTPENKITLYPITKTISLHS